MTVMQMTLTEDSELVQQALYFIQNSYALKITPLMIMTCASEDENCDHPVCFIYGGENWMITERGSVVPLTPFVTPWQVGVWLIEHDWAYNERETMRYGVRVKWFDLAIHVLMR